MIGDRTADREALVNRYGLSRRLASRIVALLSKQVDVSGTLLEIAAADSTLEAVLLESDWLTHPEALTEETLRARAAESGFGDGELLRVLSGEGGWRTIALEDDVIAEQTQRTATQPLGGEMIKASESGISRLDTEELFTPEEVARLKLAALTSQKVEERIEALRKLVFAPMGGSQKASLFVNVLIDPVADIQVRREAVRSLEQIGLRQDLADAVHRMFDAKEEDVIYAVRRLGALLGDAEEVETGVTLAVVLELFNEAESAAVLTELLRLITQSAFILAKSPQKTEQFIESALRHLSSRYEHLRQDVEEALMACWRQTPELMGDLLWKEIGRTKDSSVRSFLVNLSVGINTDEKRLKHLASVACREIVAPILREQERSHLRYAMVRLGDPAANAVIERLRGTTGRECAELIRLVDVICTEGTVSEQTVNDAVKALLDHLKVGEQMSRRLVLEAAVCADPRVEEQLQSRLATELLSHIAEFRLPGTAEAIYRTLEKIGPPAMQPLFDYVCRRFPNEDAEHALIGLGRIVRSHGDAVPHELWQKVFDYCEALFDDATLKQGGFTIALADLCGYTTAGAKAFDGVLKALKKRLWKARYTLEIFDALGIMAGSVNVRPKQQRELFGMFDEIANTKGPDRIGVKRMTEEGAVYEFGAEILFDTRIVPAVVRGLELICVSAQATKALRREIVKRLLIIWEGVSNVRIVWSPSGVEALIRAMCSAACCEQVSVEMRVMLGRSLLRYLNKVSVVRSVGEICAQVESHKKMQELCIEAGEAMLEAWENCDEQDDERMAGLVAGLGRIAANSAMDPKNHHVERLRENVLAALFQALRSGVREVKAPLELMRDCPDLSDKQRDEIRERLSHYFGLIRVGR